MALKTYILAALLAFTTTAIPLEEDSIPNLHIRAGAPVPRPLPSNCNIDTPTPTFQPGSSNYQTKQLVNSTAILYYYYLSPDSALNQTMCMEQCYGYGDGTQCKSVFMANNALTPPGYLGTNGGDLRNVCLMFKRRLIANDFEPASVQGTYQSAVAKNIMCPPQSSAATTTAATSTPSSIPTSAFSSVIAPNSPTVPQSTTASQTTSATTSSVNAPIATTSPAGGPPPSSVSTPTVQPSSCPPLSFD